MIGARPVRAPRGRTLNCKGWPQEAALRMLMNNLDPEVAERPDDLVVYGGTGRAARSWEAFDAIVACLKDLENNETLIVQSGKPVAVFSTHPWAPRVLISNAMIVPAWATLEEFGALEAAGLTMFGQMTAGSWAYIGTQGILQSTYETFAAIAAKRSARSLAGTITLTSGLGGMGGAQPLAITMNGGVAICVEVDQPHIQRRIDLGYLDLQADDLDDAIRMALNAKDRRQAISIGLLGNGADIVPAVASSDVPIDIVTDQTSAHEPLTYIPVAMTLYEATELRKKDPGEYVRRARESMARHVEGMIALLDKGAEVFEYGNSLRAEALLGGCSRSFDFPGFVSEYIRPYFFEAKGHCRWIALSGDSKDIARIDRAVLEELPENESVTRWIKLAERIKFQGLPARTCMLGYGERDRIGLRINELVAKGEVSAPVAIGREHLDAGSVASPLRETEGMKDGSDAIADWPILNALLNASSGAAWVAVHHGGGVGIGRSIHAGMVCVADGTAQAAEKLACCLTNDPGIGIARHVDAGYDLAATAADRFDIRIPMRSS